MATFIVGSRSNAPRIPDEVWEKFKPTIVEKYKTMTLPEVKTWMEREHSFSATKRQYVHRFLHVWRLKKYKQNTITAPRSARADVSRLDIGDSQDDGEQESSQGTLHHGPLVPPFSADDPPVLNQGATDYPVVLMDPEQYTGWNPPGFLGGDRY